MALIPWRSSPDFLNFTDAAYVLNNVGISCPVVFNVRDTIYDEQIKITCTRQFFSQYHNF